jgi:hypothetical protein
MMAILAIAPVGFTAALARKPACTALAASGDLVGAR